MLLPLLGRWWRRGAGCSVCGGMSGAGSAGEDAGGAFELSEEELQLLREAEGELAAPSAAHGLDLQGQLDALYEALARGAAGAEAGAGAGAGAPAAGAPAAAAAALSDNALYLARAASTLLTAQDVDPLLTLQRHASSNLTKATQRLRGFNAMSERKLDGHHGDVLALQIRDLQLLVSKLHIVARRVDVLNRRVSAELGKRGGGGGSSGGGSISSISSISSIKSPTAGPA